MTTFSRRAVIAVGAAVLLTGSVFGTAAFAADPTPTAGTATAQTDRAAKGQAYKESFLSKLAAALGVDQTKLTDSIKKAQTEVIDESVTKGDLTQAQADQMKQRLDQGRPGLLMPFGGRGGPEVDGQRELRGIGGMRDGTVVEAIAGKLGLTTDELSTQLRSGKTLAQLATEKGVTEQALKDVAIAARKADLDQAVKDGKLTQAQADKMLKRAANVPLPMAGGPRGHR